MSSDPQYKPRIKNVDLWKSDILQYDVDHIPADIRRKAMYSTELADTYTAKPQEEAGRGKSVAYIHNYFAKREGKEPAPFWRRDISCRYNTEYVPLPLDAAPINRELAKTFAPVQYVPVSGLIGDKTVHKQTYIAYEGIHKAEPVIPAVQVHVSKHSRFMREQTTTHEDFPGVEVNDKTRRPPQITPFNSNAATGFKLDGRPKYDEDYNKFVPEKWDVQRLPNMKKTFIDRENSSRVMGAQIPQVVMGKLFDREQAEERLLAQVSTDRLGMSLGQPLFAQFKPSDLVATPLQEDPFDALQDEAMRTGQVGKLNQLALLSQTAKDVKTVTTSPPPVVSLFAPGKEIAFMQDFEAKNASPLKAASPSGTSPAPKAPPAPPVHASQAGSPSWEAMVEAGEVFFYLDPITQQPGAIHRADLEGLRAIRDARVALFDLECRQVHPVTFELLSTLKADATVPRADREQGELMALLMGSDNPAPHHLQASHAAGSKGILPTTSSPGPRANAALNAMMTPKPGPRRTSGSASVLSRGSRGSASGQSALVMAAEAQGLGRSGIRGGPMAPSFTEVKASAVDIMLEADRERRSTIGGQMKAAGSSSSSCLSFGSKASASSSALHRLNQASLTTASASRAKLASQLLASASSSNLITRNKGAASSSSPMATAPPPQQAVVVMQPEFAGASKGRTPSAVGSGLRGGKTVQRSKIEFEQVA